MTTSTTEWRESVPPDETLSVIANEHRRAILRSLNRTEGKSLEFSVLTDQVADHVRNGEQPDDEHRQRVHTALHHIHLPKLEACGMIVYDTETKQVRNTTGELGQELLTLVESYEVRD